MTSQTEQLPCLLLNKVFNKPALKPCDTILGDSDSSTFAPASLDVQTHLGATLSSLDENESSDAEANVEPSCTRQNAFGCGSNGSHRELIQGYSVLSESSLASVRGNKRHVARRVMIVHTMGSIPSKALRLLIETEDKIDQHYSLDQDSLGKGAFGVVKKATLRASGAVRAVKIIAKQSMKERLYRLKEEIEIMKLIDHPNLLMLYEIFEDSDNLYLALQMCAGGHVQGYVEKNGMLSEVQAGVVMRQVLLAVCYLHKQHICHRDLKAENCLLQTKGRIQKCNVKVADFGLSCQIAPGEYLKTTAGTLSHMAPEVLARRYRFSCDVWSCGVMSYYLLSGQKPFDGTNREVIKSKIANHSVKFETIEWIDVSQPAMNFISELLIKNPEHRCSAEQALVNDWLVRVVPKADEVRLWKDTLVKVMKFRKLSKLQQAFLHVMASMVQDSEIETPRRFFMMTDNNGDGVISFNELSDALGVDMPTPGPENRDDLSYTEFLAATIDMKKHMRSELLRATFSSFDKNGDGALSVSDLSGGKLVGAMSVDELIEEMEKVDVDGNGDLSWNEFRHMMSRVMKI